MSFSEISYLALLARIASFRTQVSQSHNTPLIAIGRNKNQYSFIPYLFLECFEQYLMLGAIRGRVFLFFKVYDYYSYGKTYK